MLTTEFVDLPTATNGPQWHSRVQNPRHIFGSYLKKYTFVRHLLVIPLLFRQIEIVFKNTKIRYEICGERK